MPRDWPIDAYDTVFAACPAAPRCRAPAGRSPPSWSPTWSSAASASAPLCCTPACRRPSRTSRRSPSASRCPGHRRPGQRHPRRRRSGRRRRHHGRAGPRVRGRRPGRRPPGSGWADVVVTPGPGRARRRRAHHRLARARGVAPADARGGGRSRRPWPRPTMPPSPSATSGTSSATCTSSSGTTPRHEPPARLDADDAPPDRAAGPARAGSDRAAPVEPPTVSEHQRSVLYALKRCGEATVETVASSLGITVSGARQHLTALADDRLVIVTEKPREPGARAAPPALPAGARRRAAVPQGLRRAHQRAARLPVRRGRATLVEILFHKRRDSRIGRARARLATRASSLAKRVAELAEILTEDGYLADWEKLPGRRSASPSTTAPSGSWPKHPQACSSEIEFLRAVLPDATVERVQHMIVGACAAPTRSGSAERLVPFAQVPARTACRR